MSYLALNTSGQVNLLDCTLRDGGYYNEWDYSPSLVRVYLSAMQAAAVPIVELGFRTLERGRYLGPTAFTTDRYIESLDIPADMTIGVMVNAKELVSAPDPTAAVDSLFNARESSRVGLVRIAAHFREVSQLAPAIDQLHHKGYAVGVNLMQIASHTEDEITNFGTLVKSWGVEVAYFADSFGGMQPPDITRVVAALRDGFDGPVGCHTHDNMALAFANTLAAIEAGATFVDATVLGMGRGPGNARTEYLALELSRRGLAHLQPLALVSLITEEFEGLQRQYGWGSSMYYFLSAANGVHPTYIQEMTKDGRYSVPQIIGAVQQLAEIGASSFDQSRLDAAANGLSAEGAYSKGSFDATGWCDGDRVLIIGPGPAGIERREDIERFIRFRRPTVIALNAQPPIDPELVDAYVICHPARAVIDAEMIARLERPVFMPQALADQLHPTPPERTLRDYGLTIEPSHFATSPTSCTLPVLAAFPYALAAVAAGGATEVMLTGFDGFDPGDPRQGEMEEIFRLYSAMPEAPPVVSLTRTRYSIAQSSLYAD